MITVLCFHNATARASYRYRVGQFLPYWRDYDIDVHTVCISGLHYVNILRFLFTFHKYDVVLLQKKIVPKIVTLMIARRSKLIYDFDDAMFASKSPEQNKKEGGNRHTIGKLNYILKKSSIVFAGSTDLVDYAATYNNNVHLMPTGLEAKVSEPVVAAEAGRVTIGWIGNDVNLFYLSAIDEALQVIQNKYPETRFSLMCGKKPEGLKTIWEFEAWSQEAETPWLHSIDIGIMPLTDDPWSRGKCAFKLLQYMSFGKPVVASNVGANRLAVQHAVNGYLASENEEWVKAIEKLIRDRNLRITMGRESLRIFTEQYERSLIQRKIADAIHTLGKLNAS